MKAGLLVMMQALLLLQLAHAHPGIGIVQDSRGNIYYTDLKQVLKLDLQVIKRWSFQTSIPTNYTWIIRTIYLENICGTANVSALGVIMSGN
ncbi:MAG: hypothetical protein JST14_14725 [Bacteroidetes bacterium]|nr:hypothetical protein [Bacteroidota bacterium]